MMNEKTINEQYAYIRTLLEEKRLKEALMQLESLLTARFELGEMDEHVCWDSIPYSAVYS